MLIFPPLFTFSLVTGIKSYYQTCWQLLHTSLHSLSTFFSFMMERRKEIIHNPLVTASHCSASDLPLLSVLHCSKFSATGLQSTLAGEQPSISLSQSFALLSLFPHTILAVFWVFRTYSPCLSILLQSLFALRRLHSASYPFLKSASESGSCLPPFLFPALFGPFCQFLDSTNVRWFQLQSMRVRNHTLLSNPIWGPLSQLFRSGFQNCLLLQKYKTLFGSQQKLV